MFPNLESLALDDVWQKFMWSIYDALGYNLESLSVNNSLFEEFEVLKELGGLTSFKATLMTPAHEDIFKGLPFLLELKGLELDASYAKLDVIGHLTTLEKLRLYSTRPKELWHLSSLTGLVDLDIGVCMESFSTSFCTLTNLTRFRAFSPMVGDNDVCNLSSLVNLVDLDVSLTARSDVGMESLAHLSNLRHLNVEDTYVTSNGIGDFSSLQSLALGCRDSQPNGNLIVLTNLTNLTKLKLRHLEATNKGLAPLVNLQSLTDFSLHAIEISHDVFVVLAHLTALRVLCLEDHLEHSEDVEGWICVRQLRKLVLKGKRWNAPSIRQLTCLKKLNELELHYMACDDTECLAPLVSLTRLAFHDALAMPKKERAWERLSRLTNVMEMDVVNTSIKRESVDFLKAAIPFCNVFAKFLSFPEESDEY